MKSYPKPKYKGINLNYISLFSFRNFFVISPLFFLLPSLSRAHQSPSGFSLSSRGRGEALGLFDRSRFRILFDVSISSLISRFLLGKIVFFFRGWSLGIVLGFILFFFFPILSVFVTNFGFIFILLSANCYLGF